MKADLNGIVASVLLIGMKKKACSMDRTASSALIQKIQDQSLVKEKNGYPARQNWNANFSILKMMAIQKCKISPELLATQEKPIDEVINSLDFAELKAQGLDYDSIRLIRLIAKSEIANCKLGDTDENNTAAISELSNIMEKSEDEIVDLSFELCLTNLVKKYLERYSSLERLQNEEIGDPELDKQASDYSKAMLAGNDLEGFQEETLKHFLGITFGVLGSQSSLANQISTIFVYHDGSRWKLDEKTFASVYKNLADDERRILTEALNTYIDRLPV